MDLQKLARVGASCLALGLGSAVAGPIAENPEMDLVTIIQGWQQRVLNENLPVADPQNWALRNMARFSALSADRVGLLQKATTLGEVEALLVTAPIGNGTNLEILKATLPGNIHVMEMAGSGADAKTKATPDTSPASYADLAFTALTPCRIYDSRISQGGSGTWVSGGTRVVQVGPYPGGYAFQGGSATSCGLDTLAGNAQIAAIMASVSTTGQTGAGYLTFYAGGTNPFPFGVSQTFRLGLGVQTSFVVMPTDLISGVWTYGAANSANTEVILDIVGYFAKPKAAAFDCVNAPGTTVPIAAGANAQPNGGICPAGYSYTTTQCFGTSFALVLVTNSGSCAYHNSGGSAADVTATNLCCRTAGR